MTEFRNNDDEKINESMLYFDRIDHTDLSRAILLMEKYKEYYNNTDIADLQIAIYYEISGNTNRSKEIIREIINRSPESEKIVKNCNISLKYFEKNFHAVVELIESLEENEKLYGEWIWIHPYYMECLISIGAYQKIINIYKNNKNVVKEERNPNVYYGIGYCYEKQKNYKNAVILYEESLNVNYKNYNSVKGIFRCNKRMKGVLYAIKILYNNIKHIYKEDTKKI